MTENEIRFDDRVAVVTGAGQGLGRAHAMGLAARGAKVVVLDQGLERAAAVVQEIESAGGEAEAEAVDVTRFADVEAVVGRTLARWGRVDILVNNAGILRDKTFLKMELADFRLVLDVHVMGSVNCLKAVLPHMRERGYGRLVLTSSASGIFGNFGQANYGAAKTAMIGLMNVLHIECAKHGITINTLVPTAATAMTSDLMDAQTAAYLTPESVTAGLLFLVSDSAPSRVILSAGAGCYACTHLLETPGIFLSAGERTPETIAARFGEISTLGDAVSHRDAGAQMKAFVERARAATKL